MYESFNSRKKMITILDYNMYMYTINFKFL